MENKKMMPLWAKNLITSLLFGIFTAVSFVFFAFTAFILYLVIWAISEDISVDMLKYNMLKFICLDFLLASTTFFTAGVYKIVDQTIKHINAKRNRIS